MKDQAHVEFQRPFFLPFSLQSSSLLSKLRENNKCRCYLLLEQIQKHWVSSDKKIVFLSTDWWGAKSPVIMLQSSKCINVMKRFLESTMTSVRSTWHVSLISLHHLPRWACCLSKSDSASSTDFFFFCAYSLHLFIVYWAGHCTCLLEQLCQWWRPSF